MEFSNIKIRQAKMHDIESIAEIKVKSWQSAYKEIVDNKYLNSLAISKQINIIKKYSLDTIFIAEKDNEILGFCRFYIYDKPIYKDKEIDCEIREIYVKTDVKRMGIGNKLFNHTLKHFKQNGKKKMYLGCFKENYNARAFYEKLGGILTNESEMIIENTSYPIVSYIFRINT